MLDCQHNQWISKYNLEKLRNGQLISKLVFIILHLWGKEIIKDSSWLQKYQIIQNIVVTYSCLESTHSLGSYYQIDWYICEISTIKNRWIQKSRQKHDTVDIQNEG